MLCGAIGCSSALPRPKTADHPNTETRIIVASKPTEPVQVDLVGTRPSATAVWIDGQWEWRGRRWVWIAGNWQEPPSNSYYAPSILVQWPIPVFGEATSQDAAPELVGFGTVLLHLPGHWHRNDGTIVGAEKKSP